MPLGGAEAKAVVRGIRADLISGLQSGPKIAEKICYVPTSTKRSEEYFVGGTTAQVREWTDERVPAEMFETSIIVENKHFEASLSMHRDDMDDDQVGIYSQRARELGIRASAYEEVRVLKDLIDAAESATGAFGAAYDTQAFFDTDHVDPGPAEYTTAQDNDTTSNITTPAAPTLADLKAAVLDMISNLTLFKDDKGQPWHIALPNKLIALVPPSFVNVFNELNQSQTIAENAAAITNIWKGSFDIFTNLWTVSDDRFILIVPGPMSWPFILQRRLAPRFSQVTGNRSGELSDDAWNTLFDKFGVDFRLGVGFAQWRSAILHTFT